MLGVAGRINTDYVMYLTTPLKRGEKQTASSMEKYLGGSGANAAVAAARYLGSKKVYMVGAVGDDEDGYEQLGSLRREGIITDLIKILNAPTGRSYILVEPSGASTIISVPGANAELRLEHISDVLNTYIKKTKGFIIMNPPKDIVSYISQKADEMKYLYFLDPGRGWINNMHELSYYLPKSTEAYYMPNEVEFLEVIGSYDALEGALLFMEKFTNVSLIIKRGEKGSILIEPGRGNIVRIKALKLEDLGLRIINTAGCGDVFTGVFAAAKISGHSNIEALKLATIASGVKAAKPSARDSLHYTELMDIYERIERLGMLIIDEISI